MSWKKSFVYSFGYYCFMENRDAEKLKLLKDIKYGVAWIAVMVTLAVLANFILVAKVANYIQD